MNKNKLLRKTSTIGTIILIILMLGGCEDVIQVDLNSADPRIVIEAYILDNPGISAVIISNSTDYYNPSEFALVSAELVTISDNFGNIDTLFRIESGLYISYSVELIVNRSYTATVIVDGITYTASAMMPVPIAIDSISTEYQEGGGFGSFEEEGYRLHVYFTDLENIDDYCRLKITQNDTLLEDYYLYDGKFSDGNPIDYEYFFEVFQVDDILIIDLYTMDYVVFDYFETLLNVIASSDGGESNAVPANPNTNWDNDALGYFGVFAVRSDTIIVEEDNTSP